VTVLVNEVEVPVLDAHTHLGRRSVPLGHGVASFLGEDILRNMEGAGVDRAVVFPLGSPTGDYTSQNEIIAEEVAKYPEQLIGFCRVNPNAGPESTASALEHCLGTRGLRGVKLHPEIEFFDPNDGGLMEPIYEAARQHGAPLIFHTGMSSKAAPAVIAELAANYPDVPVILGHMGVSEYAKQAISMAYQHDNIFLETSVVGWMPLLIEAFKKVGPSKILYGSDHPYNPLPMEVQKLTVHVAPEVGLRDDDLRRVMGGNLLDLLGPTT